MGGSWDRRRKESAVMKPRVMLLCCAALVVLSAGYPGLSARATAQVPGEAPSFLTDYVDAVRVGDWFLACVEATAPEERCTAL